MRALLCLHEWEGAEGQSGIGVLLVASNDNRPCSWERIGRIVARVVADAAERIEERAGIAQYGSSRPGD